MDERAATDPLEVLTIDVDSLDRWSTLLEDIYARRVMGAIVSGVFSPDHMASVAARLAAGVEGMPRAIVPTFSGGLYGTPLVLGSADLHDYLEDAQRFREAAAPLFACCGGLERRIELVLGRIANGLPVDVARARDGRGYLPASVRVLIEGDSLPIHYENGTTRYESMRQLLPELDVETIMSFYVPVALPEAGGVLEVFTADCSGDGDRLIRDLGGPERARAILSERGYREVLPGVGDMLIFDGGRHYHLVSEVRGGSRWTLGGFFAFSSGHDRIVYWS